MTTGAGECVEWVTIGLVAAPQGVRGEVRVRPLTDFPERFLDLERVHLLQDGARTEAAVEWVRAHARGLFVLKLLGVDDRDGADKLRQADIQVPRDEAVPLPAGSYYIFDLVGAEVVTQDGSVVGRLDDVMTTTANDVYVVKGKDGREALIPAVKHVVLEIDPAARRIIVDPPPGLME